MIIKSFEINKIDLNNCPFILMYGKNEGLKDQITNELTKNHGITQKYDEKEIEFDQRPELDRWILSELNSLIISVDEYYNDYEPTKAARAINIFVIDNLSNWYVRLSRRRFWKGDYEKDKISAFQTLFDVLVNIAKLSAPISPFFMDRLFIDLCKNLNQRFSLFKFLERRCRRIVPAVILVTFLVLIISLIFLDC